MRVVILDVGLGNLRSVERALEAAARERALEATVLRSAEPSVLASADRLVVPGQGGFRDGARALAGDRARALTTAIERGTPYLGICLGLQLLFEASSEAPGERGLGVLRGRVERLVGGPGVKIPHMGWNQLEPRSGGHPLLDAAGGEGAWVMFAHSYHAVPAEPGLTRAVARHGGQLVTAAIARDHLFATQFHPEKSQRAGLALLGAFLGGAPIPRRTGNP
ncbi:MAG: imidazole glycerol phosphate synthase subunit HisH [Sorangiineae bacterium]|nr:imidazole glycerol phosphate synthase subunit HisH [Polyangiaceae bacterium]MEB2324509.1 imidazole glycerol phosphate synthase subunit HisH [Sorangiineae bacterium]